MLARLNPLARTPIHTTVAFNAFNGASSRCQRRALMSAFSQVNALPDVPPPGPSSSSSAPLVHSESPRNFKKTSSHSIRDTLSSNQDLSIPGQSPDPTPRVIPEPAPTPALGAFNSSSSTASSAPRSAAAPRTRTRPQIRSQKAAITVVRLPCE
jgi:hypothetical protein